MRQLDEPIVRFKIEFLALVEKYKLGIKPHDSYVQDRYVGTDYFLTIAGEPYYQETIEEIMNNLLK